jgi:Na+-driven multidrug efflux pump
VAGPSICTRFSTFGVTVISQAFVGHIGPTELAAYALVSTVLMRFSSGILVNRFASHTILLHVLSILRSILLRVLELRSMSGM